MSEEKAAAPLTDPDKLKAFAKQKWETLLPKLAGGTAAIILERNAEFRRGYPAAYEFYGDEFFEYLVAVSLDAALGFLGKEDVSSQLLSEACDMVWEESLVKALFSMDGGSPESERQEFMTFCFCDRAVYSFFMRNVPKFRILDACLPAELAAEYQKARRRKRARAFLRRRRVLGPGACGKRRREEKLRALTQERVFSERVKALAGVYEREARNPAKFLARSDRRWNEEFSDSICKNRTKST